MSELLATSKAGDLNTARTASLLSIFRLTLKVVSRQTSGIVFCNPYLWRVFSDWPMLHFTSKPSETPHFRATPSWSQQGGGR